MGFCSLILSKICLGRFSQQNQQRTTFQLQDFQEDQQASSLGQQADPPELIQVEMLVQRLEALLSVGLLLVGLLLAGLLLEALRLVGRLAAVAA